MKIKEWGIQAEIREMRGEGHRRIRYILNVQYADFSVSFQKNYIFNGLWQWIFKKACYNIFLFCVSLNFLRISRKFHTNFNFDERAALSFRDDEVTVSGDFRTVLGKKAFYTKKDSKISWHCPFTTVYTFYILCFYFIPVHICCLCTRDELHLVSSIIYL